MVGWTAPSAPSQNRSSSPEGSIQTLAQLPNAYSFAGTPVMTANGRDVVTLLEYGVDHVPTYRLARIDLPNRHIQLGPRVPDSIAIVFSGPDGKMFLLDVSNSRFGHESLWRVSSYLRLTLLAQFPYTMNPSPNLGVGPAQAAVAYALVPGTENAWIADGHLLELVDLNTGTVIAARPAPHGISGNIVNLAMPPDGSVLYLTYCLPRRTRPPIYNCGMVAKVNPATGHVLAQANYGPVGFGYSAIVATDAGVWLSAGGGGFGRWMAFLAKSRIELTTDSRLLVSLGELPVLATGNTVWASGYEKGAVNCYVGSTNGTVKQAVAVPGSLMPHWYVLKADPFAYEPGSHTLLLAAQNGSVYAVRVPSACYPNG